jgi:primosomal protein N' (replication factor Y)
LSLKGAGTEKVEIELKEAFPEAFLIRMDRDTVAGRESHRKFLQLFLEKEKSILLGTQMIAKGLDFPDITLVGILNADTALNMPDFRAEERTFQLIMQAGGRAGRGNLTGRVIIQTLNPKNPAILFAASGDYESFYKRELKEREEFQYPPFKKLIRLVSYAKNEKKAEEPLLQVAEELKENGLDYLGPSPAPLQKLHGFYRYHLTIKLSPEEFTKISFLKERINGDKRLVIDVDPVSML